MASIVGVDAGATGVRAVELGGSAAAPVVRHAAAVPLHPGVVVNGAVEDPPALALALKDLWKRGRFSTRSVALVLGGHPRVLARPAEVLWTDNADDFRGLVHAEAAEALPVDIESVYHDFHVLGVRKAPTKENPGRELASTMVIGADQHLVDELVDAVERAGLHPVSVDTATFALTRLISTAASGHNRLDVIIHIGADTVLLVGAVDGQPRVAHTMNDYGGHIITQQMRDTFDLTLERAEAVKIDASRQLELGVDSDETHIVNAAVSALAGAVRSYIKEATSTLGSPLGRVWLSGRGARLGGLSDRLSAELAAPVTVLDPRSWTAKPAKLARAMNDSGQDFSLALATGGK